MSITNDNANSATIIADANAAIITASAIIADANAAFKTISFTADVAAAVDLTREALADKQAALGNIAQPPTAAPGYIYTTESARRIASAAVFKVADIFIEAICTDRFKDTIESCAAATIRDIEARAAQQPTGLTGMSYICGITLDEVTPQIIVGATLTRASEAIAFAASSAITAIADSAVSLADATEIRDTNLAIIERARRAADEADQRK